MHTTRIFTNVAFSAIFKLQVSVQEIQSPYPELDKQFDVFFEEYSDVFWPLEDIPPVCDIELHTDLYNEQVSKPPPYHYRLF